MISGIYFIINKNNFKVYVGSAQNFKIRFGQHKNTLNNNRHANSYLQRAWNKYWGTHGFRFLIVEYCSIDKLIEREQYWMNITRCFERKFGYNSRPTAESNRGFKASVESKAKMSAFQQSKIVTEETKARMRIAQKGKFVSEETKEKIRQSLKGYPRSEEFKKKISAASKGRKQSKENTEKFIERMRKFSRKSDKWPCEKGCKCACEKCNKQRKEIDRLKYLKRIGRLNEPL